MSLVVKVKVWLLSDADLAAARAEEFGMVPDQRRPRKRTISATATTVEQKMSEPKPELSLYERTERILNSFGWGTVAGKTVFLGDEVRREWNSPTLPEIAPWLEFHRAPI